MSNPIDIERLRFTRMSMFDLCEVAADMLSKQGRMQRIVARELDARVRDHHGLHAALVHPTKTVPW